MKVTRVIRYKRGTGFEGTGWHIGQNPTGDDRTLCGIALEGDGGDIIQGYPPQPTEERQGVPTCANCIRYIKFCASIA